MHWVRTFIRFRGLKHPASLGAADVERFLSWHAIERGVASSTNRQALAALLFFYGKVLSVSLPWMQEIGRPRIQRRLPLVLSTDEVVQVLRSLELPEHRVLGALLYATGMMQDIAVAAGSCGREHDHDLHACAQGWRRRGAQSA